MEIVRCTSIAFKYTQAWILRTSNKPYRLFKRNPPPFPPPLPHNFHTASFTSFCPSAYLISSKWPILENGWIDDGLSKVRPFVDGERPWQITGALSIGEIVIFIYEYKKKKKKGTDSNAMMTFNPSFDRQHRRPSTKYKSIDFWNVNQCSKIVAH